MVKGAVSGIPYTLAARQNFFFFGDSITQAGSKVQNLLSALFSIGYGVAQADSMLHNSSVSLPTPFPLRNNVTKAGSELQNILPSSPALIPSRDSFSQAGMKRAANALI